MMCTTAAHHPSTAGPHHSLPAHHRVDPSPDVLSDIQRQRHVDLRGTVNLRSMGGYRTTDGTKTTKWGVLYRCDTLASVPSDVAQRVLVGQLHIHATYDLRCRQEVAGRPYHIPHINRYAVPINAISLSTLAPSGESKTDAAAVQRVMEEAYRDYVTGHGKSLGALIKGFLRTNPSPDNAAVFHCTAGKDRTGWAAYVLLSLLDIAEEEKRADYHLTSAYYHCPREMAVYLRARGMTKGAIDTLWTTMDAFLDAAVREVKRLGGLQEYAKSHMGLSDADIQQLRDVMLE